MGSLFINPLSHWTLRGQLFSTSTGIYSENGFGIPASEWLLWTRAGREPCPHESQRIICAGFGEANPCTAGAGEGSLIKKVCDAANATQWTDHTFSGRRREIVCIADGWSRSHLEQSYSTVNTSPRCQMLVITALRKQGSHANVKCKHATPTLLCFSAQSSTIERLENTPFLRTLFLKLLANIRQPHNKYTCTFSQTNPLLHVGLVSAKIFMTNMDPPECPARHDVFGDTPRGTIPLEVPGAAGRWGTA